MADLFMQPSFNVGGGSAVPDTGFFGKMGQTFADLTKDRNFMSLLAGIGTNLDPGGAGGAIGRPTTSLIQSMAAQEATGKQAEQREKFNSTIMQLLGGLTPQDQPGPTSVKATGDKLSIDVTPPVLKPGQPGQGAVAAPGAGTSTPNLSDIIPFF